MEIAFLREPNHEEVAHIPKWGRTSERILRLIQEKGPIGKAKLAELTGYSIGTINAQLSILKRAGLVEYQRSDNETGPQKVHQPKSSYKMKMHLITLQEYRQFVAEHKFVIIENRKIEIGKPYRINSYSPPSTYQLETTTVWSFPDRGDWATHSGDYRGNWSPYVPRNLILKYSKPGELVLDQMVGSGTTLVEAKLLGRNAIGVDINYSSCILAMDRLNFDYQPLDRSGQVDVKVYHGDATNLDAIGDNSVDLIATHPPYWTIIPYSEEKQENDLSAAKDLSTYLTKMAEIANECYRVLKPGRYCAILIGDTRKHKHYVPISTRVMKIFLKSGFVLVEDIVKLQHKMKTTREKWRAQKFETYGFHKIAHEHLFVFRKPVDEKEYSKLKLSSILEEI